MSLPAQLAPWLIVLPLAMAVASFGLGPRASARLAPAGLIVLLAAASLNAFRLFSAGPDHHVLGGWEVPLGIALLNDGLSAAMLLVTAAVALPTGIYARAYFTERPGARHFWPLTWFLLGAMNALVLSADIFNLYVTLELLGLAAVGLVVITGGASAIAAGLRYLLAAVAGSLFYLMGVALIYGMHGTLDLGLLGGALEPAPAAWLAASLMTVGLLVKTALFPLHFWLPSAHGGAATPVSALLSALVIKASYYLILRLWFGPFEALVTPAAAQLLGAFGAMAVIWGSLLALRQERLKMLVAYSTVAQVGYLFLIFPLAAGATVAIAAKALDAGMYLVISHALAKAAMFLAAGSMVLTLGKDEIRHLEGISGHQPLGLFAFAIAGLTVMGLPPSGGFIAKWLLLEAALARGQWWWIPLLVVGGLLSAAYVFRVLRYAFLASPADRSFRAQPIVLPIMALVLALLSLALGLHATTVLQLLSVGSPLGEGISR